MSDGYVYDLFFSYRRAQQWPKFIDVHFLPMLEHFLAEELGRAPRIYYDKQIEAGAPWPYDLAKGIATSRILLCMWSGEYINSEWCKNELSYMLTRRDRLPGPDGPRRLVVGVMLHGKASRLPDEVRDIQFFPINDLANPFIAVGSPKYESLSWEIKKLAEQVAHAVASAPDYDPAWLPQATNHFVRIHRFSVDDAQKNPPAPSLGGPR